MKPGPKKKPTRLRILEGNPSRRPINELEPTCDLPPEKPAIVASNAIASAEWDRVTAAMVPGLYSALDTATLMTYALAWSMLLEAQRAIAADGITITTPKGRVSHPATRVWKQAVDTLAKCSDRLGLHPGARSSLNIPTRNSEPSKFDGLWGGNLARRTN